MKKGYFGIPISWEADPAKLIQNVSLLEEHKLVGSLTYGRRDAPILLLLLLLFDVCK